MDSIVDNELFLEFADVMQREFALCETAYDSFREYTSKMELGNDDVEMDELLISAYLEFIQHLFSFCVTGYVRRRSPSSQIQSEQLDCSFTLALNKEMKNMRWLIENGVAPSSAKPISFYKQAVPFDFGEKLRYLAGDAFKASVLDSEPSAMGLFNRFLKVYHPFVCVLYLSARPIWSNRNGVVNGPSYMSSHAVPH